MTIPPPESPAQRAMNAFRGDHRAPPRLHPLEKALVMVASAQLVFMPWALGGLPLWSQWISLGLSALAFILALLPRHYTEEFAREGEFRLLMWPKLLRFPLFWLGLLFLAYITTQALNPSWGYLKLTDAGRYTILPWEHITWLPTSIAAPLELMNAWRVLIIYGSAFLLACALWTGLTRRNAVQGLLAVIASNGVLLTALGLAQQLFGNGKVLWFHASPNDQFFASFTYRNHGGAYIYLAMGAALALAWWHFIRSRRRMDKSSPAILWAFLAIVMTVGLIMTESRGAILGMLALVALSTLLLIIDFFRTPAVQRNLASTALLVVLFGGFFVVGARSLDVTRSLERFEQLLEGGDASIEARRIATLATMDMARARWVQGWGAGSFRWMFPAYQKNHPQIFQTKGGNPRMFFWQYAHNDWAQGLAELGAIGLCLGVTGAGFLVIIVCRRGGWRLEPNLILLGTVTVLLLHARGEFVFHCPAILGLAVALLTLAAKWNDLARRTR